jgi:hypothetical protein
VRRRLLITGAGAIAIALSIPLVLLGRAVLATPDDVARATTGWPSEARLAKPHRDPAERVAARLLATDRVERFAEIVRIYRAATALPVAAGQPVGPIRIAHLIPKLHAEEERSQALVMAATLLAMAAGDGLGVAEIGHDTGSRALLQQALGGFRAAVRSDDRNEAAKFDLELLLRQVGMRPASRSAREQSNQKAKSQGKQKGRRQKRTVGHGEVSHADVYATGTGY